MSFNTRSSSLTGMKIGEVLPSKGSFLNPFTLPDFTHFVTVNRLTPTFSANIETVMRSVLLAIGISYAAYSLASRGNLVRRRSDPLNKITTSEEI